MGYKRTVDIDGEKLKKEIDRTKYSMQSLSLEIYCNRNYLSTCTRLGQIAKNKADAIWKVAGIPLEKYEKKKEPEQLELNFNDMPLSYDFMSKLERMERKLDRLLEIWDR